MKDPYLLHMFNSTKNVSPFDVNMAYEAEFDGVIPYIEVNLEDIYSLTQDTIFSRGPKGAKRTGIFIGGREFGLAMDMLSRTKAAMLPPFEVSVFVDPSGAITTAATLIACIEVWVKNKTGESLEGKNIHIIGWHRTCWSLCRHIGIELRRKCLPGVPSWERCWSGGR